MLKKKIAALLIAAQTLTVSTIVIEAAGGLTSYEPDFQTQELQVAGKFDATAGYAPRITLYILNPGKTKDDLNSMTSANASQIINYTDETKASADGSFEFDSFIFGGATGDYKVIVKSNKDATVLEKDFHFISPLEKLIVIDEEINKVKEDYPLELQKDALKATLSDKADLLNLEYELFDELSSEEQLSVYDKAMDHLLAGIPYEGESRYADFIDTYRCAIFIETVRACDAVDEESELTIYDIFENYGMNGLSDVQKDVYEKVYKSTFSDTEFLKVKNSVDSDATTIADYMAEILDAAVLYKINNGALKPVIRAVLDNTETYLGLDETAYSELTNGKKDTVAGILLEAGGFDTIADLYEYIVEEAVPEASKSSSNKGGNSSSSNNSSNSNSSNIYRGGVNVVAQAPVSSADEKKTTFTDLDEAKWAEKYITALVNRGIFAGRTAEIFDPNGQITREEFVKIIVNAFEIKATDKEIGFTDVNKDAWYYSYVVAAANQGIVNGISETEFGIGTPITREQMATIMARTCDKVGVVLSQGKNNFEFVDSSMISSYAKDSVERLKSAGVLNGDNNGYFNPSSYATRAEAAAMLYALLEV